MTPGGAARRLARRLACATGVHHMARRLHRRRLLIVCYHGVADDDGATDSWLLLPRAELERQLDYLARHYRVRPIDEALADLWAGRLREPTACVTFDDGYRNNVRVALPLLQRLGIPATIYLATGMIGTARLLWTTRLELAMRATAATSVDLGAVGLGGAEPLGDDAARAALARRVASRLKRVSPAERDATLARLHATLGDAGAASDRARPFALMSWDEVAAAARTGLVTFGGHTMNHEIVSRLDDAAVRAEVGGSMRAVAERVDARAGTRTFAYPNGQPEDFDARAAAAVRDAGGSAAVSTIEGLNDATTDRYALRRVVVGGDMAFDDFRLACSGAYAALKGMLARRRRATSPPALAPAHS
ncbi:MAG TPA: polysaccharide deacetylase family protein [Gemmatimonadaceae bacterium]|nr:polysaccharide deacetylase family protein [Gemmatimonadaceae bacterium]